MPFLVSMSGMPKQYSVIMNYHIIPKISENWYWYCDMEILTIPCCFIIAQWRNTCKRVKTSQILGCLSQYCIEVLVWMSVRHPTYCCDASANEFFSAGFLMIQSKFFVILLFLMNKTINYYSRLVVVCLYLYGRSMNADGENGTILNAGVRSQTFPHPSLTRTKTPV
jgi:hypothetical protein